MKKIIKFLAALVLYVPTLLWAESTGFMQAREVFTPIASTQNASIVAVANPKTAVETIQEAIVKLNALTQARYTPQKIQSLVSQKIAPLFDFNHIAREVLLVNRVRLNAEEQRFFVNRLQHSIMSALLSKLSQTNSTSFRFVSARPVNDDNIVVSLQVIGYSPISLYIDLLFHQNANKEWQVFDVALNNDSLINYYQRVVSIKIKRYGVYGMLSRI